MTPAEAVTLTLYYVVLSVLTVYSIHRFYLVRLRRRTPVPARVTASVFPPLTIQLPLYNEPNVAARLLDAVAAIRYPGTLDIQVLDDSTDVTTDIVAERVGMAQARWTHINRESSILTRVQALFLDAHFAVESAARNFAGRFFNFNGTAGVWRRQAIEEAGGWSSSTLTEDLDLSYRAQLAGWQFVFLPDVEVPAELPAALSGFQQQQHRWTKGSIQTARKLLPSILRER